MQASKTAWVGVFFACVVASVTAEELQDRWECLESEITDLCQSLQNGMDLGIQNPKLALMSGGAVCVYESLDAGNALEKLKCEDSSIIVVSEEFAMVEGRLSCQECRFLANTKRGSVIGKAQSFEFHYKSNTLSVTEAEIAMNIVTLGPDLQRFAKFKCGQLAIDIETMKTRAIDASMLVIDPGPIRQMRSSLPDIR